MKKRNIFNFYNLKKIGLSLSFTFWIIILLSCEEKKPINANVISIDMVEMSKIYLPNFDLVRERLQPDSIKTEYVFKRESDTTVIFITCGIYPSADSTGIAELAYLNSISLVMDEGTEISETLGDKFWWWSPNGDINNATNLIFIRNNVFIIFSCHDNFELFTLAISIDHDIHYGSSYIVYE